VTGSTELLDRARHWIDIYDNADHLHRTEDWLRVLAPEATPGMLIAALTHDMERAYPGPDRVDFDARKGPSNPDYNRQHQDRSARILSNWLREQGASEDLVSEVAALVAAHEEGGWPAADLVEAADCISYLEVNVDLLLGWIPKRTCYVGPKEAKEKLDDTLARIRIPRAVELARPYYERGLERLAAYVAEHEPEQVYG
jgi:hypothetical protein